MLQGKHVILGVSGSIAAYKAAALASLLKKQGADVDVVLTKNGAQFITPVTFESLTGNKCMIDTFDRNFKFDITHISIAKKADVMIVAPASADVIGKLAGGIADDMLTTTALACRCPIIIAPAMNTRMYENPIVQDNMEKLRRYGFIIAEPAQGLLACGDVGKGKMAEPQDLLPYVLRAAAKEKDLAGKKVLVTAGPTQEALDPVRYLTNHSSGKMGYALAKMAMLRGAEVTLVTGPTAIAPPPFVKVVPIVSAKEMFEAVAAHLEESHMLFKAAAVADYTPAQVSDEKMKKSDGELFIPLQRTTDILGYVAEHRTEKQLVCGFSMETQNMVENSRKKLEKKKLDMIAANNLKVAGAGFAGDTNVITLITKEGSQELPLMSKEEVADAILDAALALWRTKQEQNETKE